MPMYEMDTQLTAQNQVIPLADQMSKNTPGMNTNGGPFPMELRNSGRKASKIKTDTDSIKSETSSYNSSKVTSDSDRGCVKSFQIGSASFLSHYSSIIVKIVIVMLLVGYTVYFAFAIRRSVDGAKALIILTSIAVFLILYTFIKNMFGETIYRRVLEPIGSLLGRHWVWLRWIVIPAFTIGVLLFVILDVLQEVQQLQSLSGVVLFVSLLFIFSKHPDHIYWRPVFCGFLLQFFMGVLVLRWRPGYVAIDWVSNQIVKFMSYTHEGSAAVFGDPFFLLHPFVFMVMPMLVYFGAVMAILYYIGVIQVVASKLGWAMQVTFGTTAIESLSVAANIFLNGMDIMLMCRPYLHKLTKSEFHTFLVGNHSTVAGFAFAIFVMVGAPPQHLLSAAVMSAPAVFAVAKLNYPETEESTTKSQEDVRIMRGEETNVVEAAANGAGIAGKTVMAVVVNMVAFLSLLAFINATLSWLGARVGYAELSFEVICSYVFMPLSLLMGVEWKDCRTVASLLGLKIFTSELIAYQEMGEYIRMGRLTDRSSTIATYALCGFSGLSTLAIAVGVWNTVCPSKTTEMANQMVRVIINANISCFMTACVAGLLYSGELKSGGGTTEEGDILNGILDLLPSYKDIFSLLPD